MDLKQLPSGLGERVLANAERLAEFAPLVAQQLRFSEPRVLAAYMDAKQIADLATTVERTLADILRIAHDDSDDGPKASRAESI